jgi:quercetin dioxygenase-like cupin family protein
LNIVAGNAFEDGDKHRGWLVGHFVEPTDGVANSGDVEIKWGVHEAGEERAEWTTGETRTSILILISGRFLQRLPDREVELSKQGDYVMWGPGVVHAWKALERSVMMTVRWPSV